LTVQAPQAEPDFGIVYTHTIKRDRSANVNRSGHLLGPLISTELLPNKQSSGSNNAGRSQRTMSLGRTSKMPCFDGQRSARQYPQLFDAIPSEIISNSRLMSTNMLPGISESECSQVGEVARWCQYSFRPEISSHPASTYRPYGRSRVPKICLVFSWQSHDA